MFQPNNQRLKGKFVYFSRDVLPRKEDFDADTLLELLRLQHGRKQTREKYLVDRADLSLHKLSAPANGKFMPMIPTNEAGERIVHYIFGKSGSGKSHTAKALSHIYEKFLNVYVISPVHDGGYAGESLDINDLVQVNEDLDMGTQDKQDYEDAKIKLKYKKLEKSLDNSQLMKLELAINNMKPKQTGGKRGACFKLTKAYTDLVKKPSLWIFDDTEAMPEQRKLEFLMNSQLLTGRHNDIHMMVLNHHANNGGKTRNIINESSVFTFFRPYNRYTAYFLKEYLQCTYKSMQKVKELLQRSRSVSVYKDYSVILSEHEMYTFAL